MGSIGVTKEVWVDVDVDPDDFDTDELIHALKGRKLSPEDRAALTALLNGAAGEPSPALEIAMNEELPGRHGEALIWIERALGRFWIGRLAR